jgi:hypothetical protein
MSFFVTIGVGKPYAMMEWHGETLEYWLSKE